MSDDHNERRAILLEELRAYPPSDDSELEATPVAQLIEQAADEIEALDAFIDKVNNWLLGAVDSNDFSDAEDFIGEIRDGF